MKWKNICVYANMFVCSSHVDIRAIIYIYYMDVYIYFEYDSYYMTCILMRMHVCLCTHVRIHGLCGHACVRRMQILLFYLFYNLCQPLYMFTLVPEIHGWRRAIRLECDSCSKAWALRRFIYCFNDAVCFYIHVLCQQWQIRTVNWLSYLEWHTVKIC